MDRPPVVACIEADDVPACCVFEVDTRIWSLYARWASDAQCYLFNSRWLHVITVRDYRVTATASEYDLIRAILQRRLRYTGHILRYPGHILPESIGRDVPWWHSQRAEPSTQSAASLWTAKQWRRTN